MRPGKLYVESILIGFVVVSGYATFAQDAAQVKGQVLDNGTGSPIPFASIFVNNTSIGTVADSLGNYWLKNVPVQYTDLVISSIGFESSLTRISLYPDQLLDVVVKLQPAKQLLNEIEVKGSRDKEWRKFYERFVKEFLGDGPNAELCEIKNPAILNFHLSGDGIFSASAVGPLEIYNRAMGYKIQVILKRYESTSKGYAASYHSFFSELDPGGVKEDYRWKLNRIRSYKGSLRHFLKSIIERRTQSEGYEVYYRAVSKLYNGREVLLRTNDQVPPHVLLPEIAADPKSKGYCKLLRRATFEIHYLKKFIPRSKRVFLDFPHPISWLEIPDEFLLCPLNGVINSNANFILSGDMGQYRIADNLPQDYDPVPDEGRAYLISHAELRTIRGTLTDSASGQPLSGAHVFINNSLFKVRTDHDGHFEITKVPQGIYELVASYSDYPVQSKWVEVNEDSVTLTSVAVMHDNKDTWQQDLNGKTEALRHFRLHFMGRSFFSTIKVLNPDVIEMKRYEKKIRMRTRTTLELEDEQTGYRLHYYLKDAILDRRRESRDIIAGYVSFDTMPANSLRQSRRWQGNRDNVYYGSVNHLIKSLFDGRTREEGFEISTVSSQIDLQARRGSHSKEKLFLLPGDSILLKPKGSAVLGLKFPENSVVRYRGEKATQINAEGTVSISSFGLLSPVKSLGLIGPMQERALPILPFGYIPTSELISDPKVWMYIRVNENKSPPANEVK